jgi:hypothetical protein
MQIDREGLRRHYASLADEELLAIDPADLTEVARECLEHEIQQRNLTDSDEESEPETEDYFHPPEEDPDWLETAAIACNFSAPPGVVAAPEAAQACDVLRAAGIPSHITVIDADPQRETYMEYQVMVPGALSLKATAILDKEIFNAELEANWKTHLENLSDRELGALRPADICLGLVDRVERLKRVYREEVERRSAGS